MIDVQVSKRLSEDRSDVQIFVCIVIPVALHRTAIVVLVVPDLSLVAQAHDRSDEVDCVLLELLFCHKITFQQ
jgi:hypothetical protein